MRFIRRKGTRSVVTLFVVGALALAMTGVLYAHWTDQLDATIGIQTGSLDVTWGEGAGTDDDGIVDNDGALTPDDDGPVQIYDRWLTRSSADPALPYAEERYEKDVGLCYIGEDAMNPELLWVNALNAYPSYYCTFFASVVNTETIPVKAGFLKLDVQQGLAGGMTEPVDPARIEYRADGTIALWNPDLSATEVILRIDEGIACGDQIDPDAEVPVTGWFHVEQGAQQATNYGFYMEQQFVNWNEWTEDLCFPDIIVAP